MPNGKHPMDKFVELETNLDKILTRPKALNRYFKIKSLAWLSGVAICSTAVIDFTNNIPEPVYWLELGLAVIGIRGSMRGGEHAQ